MARIGFYGRLVQFVTSVFQIGQIKISKTIMNTETTINIIERYLEDAMSPAEKQEVETRLEEDLDFKNEFEEHKATIAGIREFRRAQLKATLRKELQEKPQRKVKFVLVGRPILSMAAAVAVLIIAGTLIFSPKNNLQKLYAEFEPDRMALAEAGGSIDQELHLYKLSFKSYLTGAELAKKGAVQAGIDTLNNIPASVEFYYFWAQYEIALVYLLNEDSEAAKEQLELLINMNGEHVAKDKAKELLMKLK